VRKAPVRHVTKGGKQSRPNTIRHVTKASVHHVTKVSLRLSHRPRRCTPPRHRSGGPVRPSGYDPRSPRPYSRPSRPGVGSRHHRRRPRGPRRGQQLPHTLSPGTPLGGRWVGIAGPIRRGPGAVSHTRACTESVTGVPRVGGAPRATTRRPPSSTSRSVATPALCAGGGAPPPRPGPGAREEQRARPCTGLGETAGPGIPRPVHTARALPRGPSCDRSRGPSPGPCSRPAATP
jgi:hypothetical protein